TRSGLGRLFRLAEPPREACPASLPQTLRAKLGLDGCGPLVRVSGGAEPWSSGDMSVASERLNGPADGRHGDPHDHRGARVGSGRAPPSQPTARAAFLDHKKLPPAALNCRDRIRMSELKRFPSLIGDIYEANLDKSVWSDVLGNVAQFVGAQAGALLWRNSSQSIDDIHTFGIKSPSLETYKEQYAILDPTTKPLLLRDVGEVASTTD